MKRKPDFVTLRNPPRYSVTNNGITRVYPATEKVGEVNPNWYIPKQKPKSYAKDQK